VIQSILVETASGRKNGRHIVGLGQLNLSYELRPSRALERKSNWRFDVCIPATKDPKRWV